MSPGRDTVADRAGIGAGYGDTLTAKLLATAGASWVGFSYLRAAQIPVQVAGDLSARPSELSGIQVSGFTFHRSKAGRASRSRTGVPAGRGTGTDSESCISWLHSPGGQQAARTSDASDMKVRSPIFESSKQETRGVDAEAGPGWSPRRQRTAFG